MKITLDLSIEEIKELMSYMAISNAIKEETEEHIIDMYEPSEVYPFHNIVNGVAIYKASSNRYIAWTSNNNKDAIYDEDPKRLAKRVKSRIHQRINGV